MKIAAAITFFLGCYLFVGTQDYTIAKAAEQEKQVKSAVHEARIHSRRCEKQGKDVLAVKSDKGPWQIRCIQRRELRV